VLLIDGDVEARAAITELIGEGEDVAVTGVGTSDAALAELARSRFDCVVLDLGPSGAAGLDLLDAMRADRTLRDVPVVAYTATEVTPEDGTRLRRSFEDLLVKDASSPERLLDETALYLHRAEARLPGDKRRMLERLRGSGTVFRGKQVLIVDDDVRNVFALTNAFEIRGMEVLFAENGLEALDVLERRPEVDLVLMDVMMPGMDGYESMAAIRADAVFQELPIIALTAKAMKADRDRCLAAGASDYIAKPVEVDQLLSLMRVWLRG
jgi:CheY-like chemotaxis protein